MSDFYNLDSDVIFLLFGCGIFATRLSDFYNSGVGFRILDVGLLQLKWHLQASVDYIITRVEHFLAC